jgi:Sap-like sulfolipid-1-addressing protein
MGDIFLLSLVAAANAALLAAVTVMLFLPSPKRLLLGYLAGALLVSLTAGFVIVFAVHQSSATNTAESTLSPAMDIALGLIFLLVAWVLRGGHDQRLKRHHSSAEETEKEPSRVERVLGRGSARVTFAVGVVLTLPGFAYLAALRDLDELNYGTVPTILVILGFNVMLLLLLEIPLLGYVFQPERTVERVQRFQAWLSGNSRRMAIIGLAALGMLLVVRGLIGLLT